MSHVKYSLFIIGMVLLSLSSQVFALDDDDDATAYQEVGKVMSLHNSVPNPNDYAVPASIEFVFTNVEGNNYWESKKHEGVAKANGSFVTHQDYFIQHVGRFYIGMVYDVNGIVAENPHHTEFIVFEKYSKAALNGCGPERELIGKPNYSLAVCVFEESVEKLVQRGWIAD